MKLIDDYLGSLDFMPRFYGKPKIIIKKHGKEKIEISTQNLKDPSKESTSTTLEVKEN